MYTQEEYLYGWLFYLLGVGVVMLCGWWLTAKLRWMALRNLLRISVGVALLVPWYAAESTDYLAPAWIIAAFEGIFDGSFWRAGSPLLLAIGVAAVVYFIGYAIWLWRRHAAT